MVRSTAALLIASMAVLLPETGYCQDAVPKARNASPQILITVDDYLGLLPAGDPMDRVRQAAQAPNAFTRFRENWPTKTGNYHLNYEHKSAGAVVTCYLTVATSDQEAQRIASESFDGWISGLGKNNKIRISGIAGLENLNKNGRFSLVNLETGAPFANLFVLREGRNVVVLFLRGPILLGDAKSVEQLLAPKLSKLMAFSPAF
jgi:hypothetical protein